MTKINMMLTIRMMMVEGYIQKEDTYRSDQIKGPEEEKNDPTGHMQKLVKANSAYSIEFESE